MLTKVREALAGGMAAVAVDAVVLAAVICLGVGIYQVLGEASAWFYAGLALLVVWWAIGHTAADENP